ncbi:translation initiation factor IF-2 [Thalassoroseus pseudoceratinae]|uniref:translation initiation factor IF-2 n=1 Tax=Thalassoroseus pseudoceratinae TaxID=2713176 RepID=UPI001421C505|nr:translation initiation factor IF-2 [Thalassoroseus pseudoceratinae]
MKIRIFALAKELGIDSKELIDYCNQAGVPAKNSALASISPEQRDIVVNFIREGASGDAKPEEASVDAPLEPVRAEVVDRGSKVRKIESSRSQSGRSRSDQGGVGTATVEDDGDLEETVSSDDSSVDESEVGDREPSVVETVAETPEATDEVTEATAETKAEDEVAQVVEQEPVAEVSDSAEQAAAEVESAVEEDATSEAAEGAATEVESPAGQAEPVADASEQTEAASTEEEDGDKGKSVEVAAEEKTDDKPEAKPTPHKMEDYIAPSGASSRPVRDMEMKPRGSISESRAKKKKEKKPNRPSVPFVAAPPPEVSTPQPKRSEKTEGPAQKPVMKLPGNLKAGDAPLRDQLQRHMEERERGERTDRPQKGRVDLKRQRGREQQEEETGRNKSRRKGRNRNEREEDVARRQFSNRRRKKRSGPITFRTEAEVELPITVRSLSEAMGRPGKDLISILFRNGTMATINDFLDEEQAMELALEFSVDLTIKRGRDIEEELNAMLENDEEDTNLTERPPVVTILGHVDHGKTSLLDTIRSANVAAGESGGITQHIASYQIDYEGKPITFVDTPGHAAFGDMRARGANVTDIIVLVIAADDGVMPQTVECISHAKASGVPIIVAMNKIDLPDTNEQKVLQDLTAHEILPVEWGGEVEVVRTSAATGQGIDTLLETILLTAEIEELKANADRPAVGVCLEAFRDEGRGVIAWLIIQKGTLSIGDVVLCGEAFGKVRAMYDDLGREIETAGPSQPVKITGLDVVPGAGDHFFGMTDLEEARTTAEERRHSGRTEDLAATSGKPKTLEELLSGDSGVKDLPLILKADTPGSLEALKGEIDKFEHPEVRTELIHDGVGGVNESDVSLAAAAGAIIIAFHVVPEDRAAQNAERQGVEIRRYEIIYEVTDHIKQALEGLLEPERVQETTGRAIVLQTFKVSRYGMIAGCRILNGTIDRNSRVHVIRDQKILGDYDLASLKREKDDAKEVREGMECGIRLNGFNDVKEGDLFEAFKVREVKRTLEHSAS